MPEKATSRRGPKPHTKLISLRIQAGESREALGYRIGVGRETIRNAEAGFVPTPRVQHALARAFTAGEARRVEMDVEGDDKRKLTPLELWPWHVQKAVPAQRKAVAA